VVGYIATFSPAASERLYARFIAAAISLETNPDRGRVKGRARELTSLSPYLMRYRVEASQVVILRIRHGARRPL